MRSRYYSTSSCLEITGTKTLGATLLKERAKMASRNPFAKDLSGTPIVADSVTTVSVRSNVFATILLIAQ